MEPRILRAPLSAEEVRAHLPEDADMVKVVVDVQRKILALGGALHADGEQVLLDDGSQQDNLWGANIYPKKSGDAQIEYTSLINIRPRQGNRSQSIQDPAIREAVASVIRTLLPLP